MTNNTDTVKQPAEDCDEINLLDLLMVVVKRKTMIFRVTLAAAVLTAVFSLFLPNIYTSTTLIYPSQEDKGLANAMMAQLGGLASLAGGALGGQSQGDLYVTMLQSDAIKDPIIDRFRLMKRYEAEYRTDVYTILDGNVAISTGKKDGVITVSVSDRDPRWAAALADAYVRELGNLTVRLNVTGAGQNRLFLENRLGEAKVDLARAEEALKAFQTKNKVLDVPEQAKATIGGVAQLRAQLALQEVQFATLQRQFTDTSQEVKNAKTSLANMKAKIDQLEGQDAGTISSFGSIPNLGQEYVRLMREFKVQETIVGLLTQQYELTKINETKDISPFQVIQSAKVPERKSKPKRSLMVILATFTAFFLSVFFAVCREYADKMSDDDKARWRKIVDMSGMRSVGTWVGSTWTALFTRAGRNGRG